MVDPAKQFCREIYPYKWRDKVKTYGVTPYHQEILNLLTVAAQEPVLECGIGTGEPLALALAQRHAKIYGVDIAEILLQTCQHNFSEKQLAAACATGDIENLPFPDNTFALTYSISTTWYLPNFAQALKEMVRITRPGGKVVFDVLNALHITPSSQWLATAFIRRIFQRELGPWQLRTPWQVKQILDNLAVTYQFRGFYVLLPTAYPNLAPYFPTLSYGWQTAKLRFLGSKLVYVCQVLT